MFNNKYNELQKGIKLRVNNNDKKSKIINNDKGSNIASGFMTHVIQVFIFYPLNVFVVSKLCLLW